VPRSIDWAVHPGTTPARSLVDAAQWAPTDYSARAVVAAGFQQRLVRVSDMENVLTRMPRARRRSLITEAVRDAALGAESVPESDLLRLCRSANLPVPSMQHRRRDADGRQRYLDAYFEEWGLHVEIDGGHHTDVRQWWADMQRQNALWIPGDRILRFPAWAIRHRSEEVVTQIRAALTAAGWRG
jgi:very-short-patch-repair endonuclease